MKKDIEELNQWLEEQAQNWENWQKANPKRTTNWPEYFRGLKNLDTLKEFIISTAYSEKIEEYIKNHKDEYIHEGHSGWGHYKKI